MVDITGVGAQAIRVLRVLCREEFGIASAKTFVEDVQRAMEWLTSHYIYTPEQVRAWVKGPDLARPRQLSSHTLWACARRQ